MFLVRLQMVVVMGLRDVMLGQFDRV